MCTQFITVFLGDDVIYCSTVLSVLTFLLFHSIKMAMGPMASICKNVIQVVLQYIPNLLGYSVSSNTISIIKL